jgi:hypothetical protein
MSKKKNRRIFGMSSMQLGILGILSLLAIVVIFGGFIILSSSPQAGGSSVLPTSSAPEFLPDSATTPELLDITELSLTATMDPNAAQIPPDWKQYRDSLIEVRVPPQFNSVDYESIRQERIRFFREQGSEILASQFEQDIFEGRFWFKFSQPETVPFVTSVIIKAEFLPTDTLTDYVDQVYGEDLQGYELLDRQTYPIEGLEAERLLMVVSLNEELSLGVAEYVVTDEINLWIISCWSDFNEFPAWLPEFDRVARSFRLLY